MNKKPTFEWVVVSSKGEDLILTENQYKVFRENRESGTVAFEDFEINPSFVVKAYRREAQVVNLKYRCETCTTNGWVWSDVKRDEKGELLSIGGEKIECPICHGTGVDLSG